MKNNFPSDLSENWKISHTNLLCQSYLRFFKKPLHPLAEPTFEDLFEAPFILLSHGTQPDPLLNFGNRSALELWELTWEELTQMPSRLTAEPMEQNTRSQFMAQVQTEGFVSGYEGVRISKSGKRFRIQNAKVWNLIDENNLLHGQAASFDQWTSL